MSIAVLAITPSIAMSEDRGASQVRFQERFTELHQTDALMLSHNSLKILARVNDHFRLLLEVTSGMGEGSSQVTGANPFYLDTQEDYHAFIDLLEAASRTMPLTAGNMTDGQNGTSQRATAYLMRTSFFESTFLANFKR